MFIKLTILHQIGNYSRNLKEPIREQEQFLNINTIKYFFQQDYDTKYPKITCLVFHDHSQIFCLETPEEIMEKIKECENK